MPAIKILQPHKVADQPFITRADLALRWRVHPDTIRRWQYEGRLHPVTMSGSGRVVRYPMSEVLEIEKSSK